MPDKNNFDEIITLQDRKPSGRCILIYGAPGVGKSFSALSLPDDLLIINAEKKSVNDVIYEGLELRNEPERKIYKKEFNNFDEILNFLGDLKLQYKVGNKPYQSIFFDGLSFAQSDFKLSMEDDRHLSSLVDPNKKREDVLSDKFRLEQSDWGGLASMMKRITSLLNRLSLSDINIVCSAWSMGNPSYDKTIDFAPHFVGKEYSKIIMGYFNIIGLVVPNPNTGTGYPPIIRFKPTFQHNFVARGGHTKLSNSIYPVFENNKQIGSWIGAGELNFTKIINIVNK